MVLNSNHGTAITPRHAPVSSPPSSPSPAPGVRVLALPSLDGADSDAEDDTEGDIGADTRLDNSPAPAYSLGHGPGLGLALEPPSPADVLHLVRTALLRTLTAMRDDTDANIRLAQHTARVFRVRLGNRRQRLSRSPGRGEDAATRETRLFARAARAELLGAETRLHRLEDKAQSIRAQLVWIELAHARAGAGGGGGAPPSAGGPPYPIWTPLAGRDPHTGWQFA